MRPGVRGGYSAKEAACTPLLFPSSFGLNNFDHADEDKFLRGSKATRSRSLTS